MAETSDPMPTGPAIAEQQSLLQERNEVRTGRLLRWIELTLLGIAAVFFVLHFVHLKADFPNHSFWMDWAKYTDEGWYGDAAIRHYQWGQWNVPGDFNPAAALPLWPAMEIVLFRFAGVSLVAARAMTVVVFGLTLVCCYALLRRWLVASGGGAPSLAPAMVVLLLAVSPFLFAFTRIAILEPLLVLLTLAALFVAARAGAALVEAHATGGPPLRPLLWTAALGLMFPLMVLTKTTAIFLFPSILWMVWASTAYRVKAFLRVMLPACLLGAVAWGAYYGLFVHPRYLTDYEYLFSANAYTGFTWSTLGTLLFNTVLNGIWIGKILFVLDLAAIFGSIVAVCAKGPRHNPLTCAMLLWVLGYGAFLTYHANLQPRYYIVLAVPLTVLMALVFEPLLAAALRTWSRNSTAAGEPNAGPIDILLLRIVAGFAAIGLLFAAGNGARQTLGFVLHPEYTWVSAAAQIHDAVEREVAAHPDHSPLLLSISGSDISLMTGLRSICDDFGTMTLPDRIAKYKPGFFATWNEVEDDKMDAMTPIYRLVRVMSVPAFDDPDRNLLILYRMDPSAPPGPPPQPRRKRNIFVRHSLRTKIGEQPSASQLEH